MQSKQTLFVFTYSLLATTFSFAATSFVGSELLAASITSQPFTKIMPIERQDESCVDLTAFVGNYRIDPNSCFTTSLELPDGRATTETQLDHIDIEMGADSSEDYKLIRISKGQEFSISSPRCGALTLTGANQDAPDHSDKLSFENWSSQQMDADYTVMDSVEYVVSATNISALKKYSRASVTNVYESSTESLSSWSLQVLENGNLQIDTLSKTSNWYESKEYQEERQTHCQFERITP